MVRIVELSQPDIFFQYMKYFLLVGFPAALALFANPAISKSLVEANFTTTKIVQKYTRTADDYLTSADQKFDQDDYSGALADYNQAIALTPEDAEAHHNRGMLKQDMKDRLGAINDLQAAVRLYRQQGQMSNLRDVLDLLRKLGATE